MKEDKPIVSRRFASVASVFLILALIVAIYLLATGMHAGTSNPFIPQPPPEERKWELSPLIQKYGITSVPVIVINCKYMRVGSDVLRYGDDAERSAIGSAMCAATNSSTFCSRFRRTYITVLNSPECKSGNKTLIYAFHSPSCPISSAQRIVLDAFRDEFQHDVALEYICTPRNEQDVSACSDEFSIGRYDQ
jgi:hypothetical protein